MLLLILFAYNLFSYKYTAYTASEVYNLSIYLVSHIQLSDHMFESFEALDLIEIEFLPARPYQTPLEMKVKKIIQIVENLNQK
jgi:hypothetical protein